MAKATKRVRKGESVPPAQSVRPEPEIRDVQIIKFAEEVEEILDELGHPDAVVDDSTTVSSLTDDVDGLAEVLDVEISDTDKLWEVAARIRNEDTDGTDEDERRGSVDS